METLSYSYKITPQHLEFMKKAMTLMKKFYAGDPIELLCMVGENNSVSREVSLSNAEILKSTGIDREDCKAKNACSQILLALNEVKEGEDGYILSFPEEIIHPVWKAFDLYCRVMLGQFSAIYQSISDLNLQECHIPKYPAWGECLNADFRYTAPFTIVDVRNSLVPGCAGIGWNGNLGISNDKTCQDAKIAYEIVKVFEASLPLRARNAKPDLILSLSGLPLIEKI